MSGHSGVTPEIRLERLLRRSERVKEVQRHLPIVPPVVPLQQHVDRRGDGTRHLHGLLRDVAAREYHGRGDPRVRSEEMNGDSRDATGDRDGWRNAPNLLQFVDQALPLGYGMLDQWHDQSVHGLRGHRPPLSERGTELGSRAIDLHEAITAARSRQFDRGGGASKGGCGPGA
ncbi:hypothetical protein ACI3KS_08620 [Microbacterium sp. ZW T5_45]|uniref:hypothetical protein n=1 Tax=Microbacterium sp. ZW T5_45 TaxID=3378080 RepID=UPI003855593A